MTSRGYAVLLGLLLVAGSLAVALPRLEGTPPELVVPSEVAVGAGGAVLTIGLADSGAGLSGVEATLQHNGGTQQVLANGYPGSRLLGGGVEEAEMELSLDPVALGLEDGPATLEVTARDWSWRGGFRGNSVSASVPISIDTKPPRIRIASGLTYVYRGGSAAAVYNVSEETARDGVAVGEAFFPGYPLRTIGAAAAVESRIALFAIPVDAPESPSVRVIAEDAAGNEASARFPAHVLEREFEETTIGLSPGFLESVAVPLAHEHDLPADDPTAAFQKVNQDLRDQNEREIRERIAESSPERHWEGAFGQLAGSKVTSRFAELRTYQVDNAPVSKARHYGFDLASTAAAEVTAANSGVVVFAGDLGIYGNCVLVDHGLGLTSLYGHLSRVDVSEGDSVQRGSVLGLSGETGLAGGDHLHFAILVGQTYVDPLEWWDSKWVRSHVEERLSPELQ